MRNAFRLEKENEVIRDIRNLFENEEEKYYKPVRVFFQVTVILNKKSKGNRNNILSVEKYLKIIKKY